MFIYSYSINIWFHPVTTEFKVVTETIWAAKPKTFTFWSTQKVANHWCGAKMGSQGQIHIRKEILRYTTYYSQSTKQQPNHRHYINICKFKTNELWLDKGPRLSRPSLSPGILVHCCTVGSCHWLPRYVVNYCPPDSSPSSGRHCPTMPRNLGTAWGPASWQFQSLPQCLKGPPTILPTRGGPHWNRSWSLHHQCSERWGFDVR